MTYKLAFNESALKEWKKLGHTLQVQFKKKLKERPRTPEFRHHSYMDGDQYKIKLRGAGYRLVYRVEDDIVTVTVIGVGKRETTTFIMQPLIAIDECQAPFWGRIRAYFLLGNVGGFTSSLLCVLRVIQGWSAAGFT